MVFLLVSFQVDLCRMPYKDHLYPISSALNCISEPLISMEEFTQNQFTVEKLVELHAFQEIAANPPPEYKHLKVDVNAELKVIHDKWQKNILYRNKAFDYYTDLSGLFLKLKDPHTLFVKPNFFKNFRTVFPVSFDVRDGFVYLKEFLAASPFKKYQQMYERQFDDLTVNPTDRVQRINGQEPLAFLSAFADKYDYSSKSSHGRLNSLLISSFYSMRLDVYNVLDVEDRRLSIEFLSGRKQVIDFTISSAVELMDQQAAMDLYDAETKKKSPYETGDETVSKNVPGYRKMFEEREVSTLQTENDPEFEKVIVSPDYFTLFKYKGDVVLSVTSFSPPDMIQSLKDTLKLLNYLKANATNSTIYLSLIGNGGGWVSLGHLLANGLFHNEYPIYGRYNVRKANLVELLLKSGSNFEDMHRVNWLSGETMTDAGKVNMSWYNKTIDNTYSDYYGMDDDQDKAIGEITAQIYAFNLSLTPNRLIALTDSQCGSTCACFLRHLQQTKNVFVVGLGGTDSKEAFDSSSFAGGAVMDSQNYESAVLDLKTKKFPGLNEAEVKTLKELWIPHKGYLRFAHHIVWGFESHKPAGLPLEYRIDPVDMIVDVYPTADEWQLEAGLKKIIEVVKPALKNMTYYGEVCKTENNVIFRSMEKNCQKPVAHSCVYGFYRGANDTCVQRTDPYMSGQILPLATWMIVIIAISGVIVVAIIAVLILMIVKREWFPCIKVSKEEVVETGEDEGLVA